MSDQNKKRSKESPKKSGGLSSPASKLTVQTTSTNSGGTDELCPQALKDKGFSIGKELNRGEFGVIYEAKWTEMPDKKLVCKRSVLKDMDQTWVQKYLKVEMKISKKLKHGNIVRCHELFKTRTAAFIFMDFIEKGNIREFMTKQKMELSEMQTKIWFNDICSALQFCHNLKIAHRDLKLSHFMIADNGSALILLFGFACRKQKAEAFMLRGTITGSADYMAPEIRSLKPGKVYDPMISDCYSLGVCLYEMLHNAMPFGVNTNNTDSDSKRTHKLQMKREYAIAGHVSSSAKDLINKLLDPDVKTRITAHNVLKHQFLKLR